MNDLNPFRVAILSTGGTIEKFFDESDGALKNDGSHLTDILAALRLPFVSFEHRRLMSKDSLEMDEQDREIILAAVRESLVSQDAIVIIHGTDTLSVTGEFLYERLSDLTKPVVLTGAMRPFEFRDTDAFQNVTEALLACRLLAPGVYAVMHNRALGFPGVVKDRGRGTFVLRR